MTSSYPITLWNWSAFFSTLLGDSLILTRSLEPGRPAQFNDRNELIAPAQIGVTLPQFFDCVRPGDPIWFDDGKIYVNDPVEDVSKANDWSLVRVWNMRTGSWGKTYDVQGFIWPLLPNYLISELF